MSSDDSDPKVNPIDLIRHYLEKKLNLSEPNTAGESSAVADTEKRRPNQVFEE